MLRRVKHGNERGAALVTVVVVMVVLGIITVAALQTSNDERNASHGVRERTHAFQAAESGIDVITAVWDTIRYDTMFAQSGDSLTFGWQTMPLTGTSFRGTLHQVSQRGARIYNLKTFGRSRGSQSPAGQQGLSVQYVKFTTYEYGLYGRDSLILRGNGSVTGDVGTGGDITNGNNVAISGGGVAGGTVSNPGQFTGPVTLGVPALPMPDVDCPTGPFGPAPVPMGNPAHVNFNAVTGDLTLTGNSTKMFPNGMYYYRNFVVTGSGDMGVALGDYVEIYVSDSLYLGGSGFFNNNNDPAHLIIYGCGTNTQDWEIQGAGDSYMSVYAPHHFVAASSSGNRYGQIVAAGIDQSGGGSLNFDSSAGLGGRYLPLPGSWVELSR